MYTSAAFARLRSEVLKALECGWRRDVNQVNRKRNHSTDYWTWAWPDRIMIHFDGTMSPSQGENTG